MKKLLLILFFAFCLLPFHLRTQWVQQSVPVSKPITGIKFIDANTGWACTENSGTPNRAYILYTSNGGTNWSIQDSVNNATYGAISVVNGNTVYCGGYDFPSNSANLKKTTNGGINWLLIPTPTNMAIGDMQFLNEDSGWTTAGNVGADVRTTTNGGLNWIVRTNGIAQQTQKIFFLNYNTGFCGANFFLYKTTDAGMNWNLLNAFSTSVQCIYFLNSNTAWVGLSPTTASRVAYTTNGGVNWIIQDLLPYIINISDVFFFNNQLGFAGVGDNIIYKTIDGGANWGYQNAPTFSSKLSFINSLTGWTGNNGISKTTNGGGNITYVGINNISTEIPGSFKLYQNYPNPFNPTTTIKLDISESSVIKLYISDILGRVHYEVINQYLVPGKYEFNWDSRGYSSGVYFYTLISDKFTETKKMLLVK